MRKKMKKCEKIQGQCWCLVEGTGTFPPSSWTRPQSCCRTCSRSPAPKSPCWSPHQRMCRRPPALCNRQFNRVEYPDPRRLVYRKQQLRVLIQSVQSDPDRSRRLYRIDRHRFRTINTVRVRSGLGPESMGSVNPDQDSKSGSLFGSRKATRPMPCSDRSWTFSLERLLLALRNLPAGLRRNIKQKIGIFIEWKIF